MRHNILIEPYLTQAFFKFWRVLKTSIKFLLHSLDYVNYSPNSVRCPYFPSAKFFSTERLKIVQTFLYSGAKTDPHGYRSLQLEPFSEHWSDLMFDTTIGKKSILEVRRNCLVENNGSKSYTESTLIIWHSRISTDKLCLLLLVESVFFF